MGLYLASDETWGSSNLLSAKYFKKGLTEEKVIDFFGLEVMREKEHETMKGIRVGERWEEGSKVSGMLIGLFEGLGRLDRRCVGEEIRNIVEMSRIEDGGLDDPAEMFTKKFCERVSNYGRVLYMEGAFNLTKLV